VWRIRSAAREGTIQIDSRLEKHLFPQSEVSSREEAKNESVPISIPLNANPLDFAFQRSETNRKKKTSPAFADRDIDVWIWIRKHVNQPNLQRVPSTMDNFAAKTLIH